MIQAGKSAAFDRLADERGVFKMLAVDHRPPVFALVAERRGLATAPRDDVIELRRTIADELGSHASALLLDPVIEAMPREHHGAAGTVFALEDHRFDERPGGRITKWNAGWDVERIKAAGGDAVKMLLWYRPDAEPDVCAHQQRLAERTGSACREHDIPFVLELLTYRFPGRMADAGPLRGAERTDLVLSSVEAFAPERFGVDVFKVESPVLPADLPPLDADGGFHEAAFTDLDAAAGRPWVLLSGAAERRAFQRALRYAFAAGASGYLAGRSIWWNAANAFPDVDCVRHRLRTDAVPFMLEMNELADAAARPWRAAIGSRHGRPTEDTTGGQTRTVRDVELLEDC